MSGELATKIDFLRRVPVLAGLDDELLSTLAAAAQTVSVAAGEWIFRVGEHAHSVYVVRSGRLEVIAENQAEQPIRVLRRGDVVGELAMLGRGFRSASVRARRDSTLLEVGRPAFEELITGEPRFALGLTRTLSGQLAASHSPVREERPPTVVAIVGLDGDAPVDEIAQLLTSELGRYCTLASLPGEAGWPVSRMAEALDVAERTEDRVMLISQAIGPGDRWTEFCLSESDLVLAVTSGVPSHEWRERSVPLRGCELIVAGRSIGDSDVATFEPREVQVLPGEDDRRRGMQATARRLAGRAIGLVLSGGGARGLAHLGAVEELQRAGIVIDRIGGVSFGAAVGAGVAAGTDTREIYAVLQREVVDAKLNRDYTVPAYSLMSGRRARRAVRNSLGDGRIEELPTRFFCQSSDLISRKVVVHRSGSLSDAVYASMAIPGVLPPFVSGDGRVLVDGAVLDNLPVATMARSGEGPIIAVDVTDPHDRKGSSPAAARRKRLLRRLLTGSTADVPPLTEMILRTATLGSIDTAAAARRHASTVINPRLDNVGTLDWDQLPNAVEAGRIATREALADDAAFDQVRVAGPVEG